MLGMTPLTRLLPDTSDDTQGFSTAEDDDCKLTTFSVSISMVYVILVSKSGIKCHILSSSRTTSAIEGRASVSSWQHLRAKLKNFTTQSEGKEPTRSSMTEKIIPALYATLTWNGQEQLIISKGYHIRQNTMPLFIVNHCHTIYCSSNFIGQSLE